MKINYDPDTVNSLRKKTMVVVDFSGTMISMIFHGSAILLLAGDEPTLQPIEHISLAADPAFQDEFASAMGFSASAANTV